MDQRDKLIATLGDGSNFYAHRLYRVLKDNSASKVDIFKSIHDFLNERYLAVRQSWQVESELLLDIPPQFQNLMDYNPFTRRLSLTTTPTDGDIWSIGNRQTDLQVESGGRIDELLARKLGNEHYRYYQSPGQRKACQAALLMDNGGTLIVNLPTGGGKTLVLQSLAKFNENRGTLLCIVPTNALKLEQAQRYFEHFCKDNLMFKLQHLTWSPDVQTREVRSEILTLIESGRLPILFCSPEALSGRLLESLKIASRSGYLHSIAVDEAHLIAQWGADFRPHFETLPLIIDSLRKLAAGKLKTVLLSATWSNRVFQRVNELFVRNSKIEYVSSGFLRAEPRYEIERCFGDRDDRLIRELLMRPSPAIIYCITKTNSESVYEALKENGLTRVGLFNGDVSANIRDKLLQQWRDGEIDVMVATSAFGVGMDKSDVRTIIHYGLPETLDRYYQDCGRAGRDGYASSCLMLYESEDIEIAKGLASVKILTGKTARNRFSGLLKNSVEKIDDSYIVAPETIPPHLVYEGSSNESWNWKTVLLLQRMGVVSLELLSNEEFELIKKDDDPKYVGLKYIRMTVLDYAVYDAEFWDTRFEIMKSEFAEINRSETKYLDTLLHSRVELCRLFGEYFKFGNTYPEVICRGCLGHSDKRLHPVGKFPVSTLHSSDLLALYGTEPIGIEMTEDRLFTEIQPLVRLLRELCKKEKVRFVRCNQAVRVEILSKISDSFRYFIVFKDIDDPDYCSNELTILYEGDATGLNLPLDEIVSISRFLVTDSGLQHWQGSISMLDRLQNVFSIDELEGRYLGSL